MPGSGGGHDGTSGEGAKFYSDFKATDASLVIGHTDIGPHIHLINGISNSLMVLKFNEETRKIIFDSQVNGKWEPETELVTKSDLTNVLQTEAGPQGDRLSLVKIVDSKTSNPYIAVYLNGSSDRYGYIPITKD